MGRVDFSFKQSKKDVSKLFYFIPRSLVVARISGINIPSKSRIDVGLTSIYGLGRNKAKEVCKGANVDPSCRVSNLNEEELSRIRQFIDQNFQVEGELRQKVSMNIKRLLDLGCYRGLRHRKSLPTRGQRTHTNA